jgi:PhoPQ-activated pathogenicity-related protein
MRETLHDIYLTYNHSWPIAFMEYKKQGITDAMSTPQFTKLTEILDPLAYSHCYHCEYYRRLSIPKYIISASGDDFFTPDANAFYIDKLPGENILRVTPNQSHFINSQLVSDALTMYYASIVFHTRRPHITWVVDSKGILRSATVTDKPKQVLLWEATNRTKRDFRMSSGVTYHSKRLTGTCNGPRCTFNTAIKLPDRGYQADFIEATYENSAGQQFIITTPVVIMGGEPNLIDSRG